MSIVDPLFTIPLLVFVIAAARNPAPMLSCLACGWMLSFLALGWLQHERAMQAAAQVASLRGHEPLRLSVSFRRLHLLVWKAIYEHEDSYYVDAARVRRRPGFGARAKADLTRHFPGLEPDSQQALDVERFRCSPTIICHPENTPYRRHAL